MKNSLHQKQLEEKAHVQSETLFQGRIFSLRQDTLTFDDLVPHKWEIIEHPGAVALIPINEAGNLLLIQQWRRPIEKIIYELPAGCLNIHEAPLECAAREIQEEIKMRANTFIPLGGFYTAPGFCNEYIHLFLARDLEKSPLPHDPHEAIDIVELSLKEAFELVDKEEIIDAKTICGLYRYKKFLDTYA